MLTPGASAPSGSVRIRRLQPLPFLIAGLLAAGTVIAFAEIGLGQIALLSPFLCWALLFAVIAYVDGPSAFVTISPSWIVVGNALFRYVVPRARLSEMTRAYLNFRLELDDGAEIRLQVFERAVAAGFPSPRQAGGGPRESWPPSRASPSPMTARGS